MWDKQDSNLHKYRLISRFRCATVIHDLLYSTNVLLSATVLMTYIPMRIRKFSSLSLSTL